MSAQGDYLDGSRPQRNTTQDHTPEQLVPRNLRNGADHCSRGCGMSGMRDEALAPCVGQLGTPKALVATGEHSHISKHANEQQLG